MANVIDINDIDLSQRYVVTFGNYDGYHLGHQHCVKSLCNKSKELGLKSILIVFDPHTLNVINPNIKNFIITDTDTKNSLLKDTPLDYIINLKFDQKIKQLSKSEFLKFLIDHVNPKCLLFGYDAKYGKGQEGNIVFAREYFKNTDIEIEQIRMFKYNNHEIKSSYIRECLRESKIKDANLALNRKFEIKGVVVKGKGFGKTLGFPTANIDIHDLYNVLPSNGVYLTIIKFDNSEYKALTNIGFRPTFSNGLSIKNIESYLIANKALDLYGKIIRIQFIDFIRSEIKFKDKNYLIKQIEKDLLNVTKMRY